MQINTNHQKGWLFLKPPFPLNCQSLVVAQEGRNPKRTPERAGTVEGLLSDFKGSQNIAISQNRETPI